MSKKKTYGPANNEGLPNEELVLAEVLAFMKDKGRGYASGNYDDDVEGVQCHCAGGV